MFFDISLSNIFLGVSPQPRETKAKTKKMGGHQPKKLLLNKGSEVKVTQSCLTLCDRMDYTVHGILQARILE